VTTVTFDKWVEGVSSRDRVDDVACRTLEARLAAIQYYLSLAAEKADEDVEYVHQLRVWVRRATAALRLYQELLPRRRLCWVRKQLKRVRRAANDARDCDVLLERLKKQTGHEATRWGETVRAERAEAQEAVVAVHERVGRDRRFARLVNHVRQRRRVVAERVRQGSRRSGRDHPRSLHRHREFHRQPSSIPALAPADLRFPEVGSHRAAILLNASPTSAPAG
jgi:CHAD domain-containing protein